MISAPAILGILIVVAAAAAMSLRNLIHSVLLLIAAWFGIGLFYLWAGAEFLAFAQILVYVGAISMVVLFAVLLTHRATAQSSQSFRPSRSGLPAAALLAAGAVGGLLAAAVMRTRNVEEASPPLSLPMKEAGTPLLRVHDLGTQLMGPQLAALLVIGVILTVALIGGVVLAAGGRKDKP